MTDQPKPSAEALARADEICKRHGMLPGGYMRYALAEDLDAFAARAINTPEIEDFLKAVAIETAHQRERWGERHDRAKDFDHWVWLIAHLVTKAAQAGRAGDREKYLHHMVSSAAACASWHAAVKATEQPVDTMLGQRISKDRP